MAYNCRTGETGGSDEGDDDWATIAPQARQMEMPHDSCDRHSLMDAQSIVTAAATQWYMPDADLGLLGEQR